MKVNLGCVALLTTVFFWSVVLCVAQNTSATAPATQPGAQPATSTSAAQPVIPVQLTKSLDARKLKNGDPVEAKTAVELRSGNGTVIPAGSKVIGHITQAEAKSKGASQSSLAMIFDHIVLKNGQQITVKTTIQAVAPPPSMGNDAGPGTQPMQQESQPTMAPPSQTTSGTTGPMGGSPGSARSFPSPPSPGSGGPQGQAPSSSLTATSVGVMGMHNVQLEPNSTLVSNGKDLKLEAGTEMMLRVQKQ